MASHNLISNSQVPQKITPLKSTQQKATTPAVSKKHEYQSPGKQTLGHNSESKLQMCSICKNHSQLRESLKSFNVSEFNKKYH